MLNSLTENYTALVLGASGGIGHAICERLKIDPRCDKVIGVSRSADPPLDFNDEPSFQRLADYLSGQSIVLDALLIATGILDAPDGSPPEKSFRQFDAAASEALFRINAIGPALAIKYFAPFLRRNGKTVVMSLSARVGSIGDNHLGGWISYRASKAALNQILHTASIELQRRSKMNVCVALHPGTIRTALSNPHANDRFTHTPEECAENLLRVLDGLPPEQTGGFFDYAGKPIPW